MSETLGEFEYLDVEEYDGRARKCSAAARFSRSTANCSDASRIGAEHEDIVEETEVPVHAEVGEAVDELGLDTLVQRLIRQGV